MSEAFFVLFCDSLDYMKGPFLLPNNIKEGDYIELGQLGAYGLTFRTKFNGFYSDEIWIRSQSLRIINVLLITLCCKPIKF